MSAKNLTRDEARHRSEIIHVKRYHVLLDIRGAGDEGATHFGSRTRVRFTCSEPETFLDLLDAQVDSVEVNGSPVEVDYDGARIGLRGLDTRKENLVEVHARLPYSHHGQGLHRFVDPADGNTYLYTHFEPADSRRVYSVFEQPDLKAHIDFDVMAPEHWRVVSNQTHDESSDLPDGGVLHDFGLTPRMSTYLSALAAGPFVRFEDQWTSDDGCETVELAILCRRSLAEDIDPEEIFRITQQGLDFYHDVFAYPYPWGKYDQVFVPEYNLGAMENPGCVTFTERYIHREPPTRAELQARANTILHEMAHMWFGDLVTPAWWDDLWLKESFAEFMGSHASVVATEYKDAWSSFAVGRKAWAYMADQLSTTHPIVADIVDLEAARQNFDGITYAKGASVLKQLVHHVSVEKFFAGSRAYFRDKAFSSATLADLLRHLEHASGRDLTEWSRAWLQSSGPDTLWPELVVEDGRVKELSVVRESVDAHTGEQVNRPHTLRVGLYRLEGEALVRTEQATVDVTSPRTPVKDLRGAPAPDLVLVNDEDLTYAKVRLDEQGTRTALTHLSGLEDSLARALVWSMLWNAVRDAALPVDSYLEAVGAHAEAETDPAILTPVLAQARQAIEDYLPAARREEARHRLAERAWLALDGAEAGSGSQTVWARHAVAVSAADPQAGDKLRGLVEGHGPEGLVVGPELRWRAWIALAALGQASRTELDAELSRDRTKDGVAHHLEALTALPDPELTAESWRRLHTPGELTNEHVDAVVSGLRTPLAAERLAQLNGDYFETLERVWDDFAIEMAQRLVIGLFPTGDPEDAAERADHWLAEHPQASTGLVRAVKERRDLAARAAAAQEFNAVRS